MFLARDRTDAHGCAFPTSDSAQNRNRSGAPPPSGDAGDLLDPDVNLKYGVKYLRGAWLLSDGDHATAIKWYARGYYYEAKRRGMLVETGLRKG